MIFVDANVLLDLFAINQPWQAWSRAVLGNAGPGVLVTNHVAVAEAGSVFTTVERVTVLLSEADIRLRSLTTEAAVVAGRAYRAYRRAGGPRDAIIADFLIGGHAAALGATLVTRDRARFASYFPTLKLITPETHP